MSKSTDPGHFFQTSDSLATSARKSAKSENKNGNPISLPSKILAIEYDATDAGAVYVAEAAGTARRVVLETGEKLAAYAGANAPLTCIALSPPSTDGAERMLFAGCWDKTIHSWSLKSRKPIRRFTGHTDFVKCVTVVTISGQLVLISGSSDATIIIWDIATGKKLHTLKGHARGILDVAIDPASSTKDEIVLFSADSVKDIRRWRVSLAAAGELPDEPIRAHETSVNKLRFEEPVAADEDDADADADLWTASSDNTAQHLVRSRNWAADTTLQHPDFVRDIVVDQDAGWVITACRDEEVRVWNGSTGDLTCVFDGHYEEVTGLALLPGADGQRANRVVSVSIDATVRTWSLDAAEIKKFKEEAERRAQGVEDQPKEEVKESMLTMEEEAELAELMDSDDE
ncbi:hypothetical protein AAFC00_005218 [Neodothiora populina]|uniref:WD repeat protein n=1 Tax=Neodothiora populina TaxID=2781224 RepID=A0ABR3PK72_9PEZI